MGRIVFAACSAALVLAAPLHAETPSAEPPPIPDLAVPEKDLGDERKFVVFHKPGSSFATALADLRECNAHAPRTVQRRADTFVPWGQDDKGDPVAYDGGPYGLVGMAIGAIIAGPIERSIRQMTMIRCMTPRGYERYRANENQWKDLFEKSATALQTAAAIASGPVPPTPKANP